MGNLYNKKEIKWISKPCPRPELGDCHICISHKYGGGKQAAPQIIRNGRRLYISRFIYEQHFGNIPEGKLICHYCDVRSCINPEHLFLGTPQDNMTDRNNKQRQARGEKQGSAKLSEKQALEIYNAIGMTNLIAEKYGISRREVRAIKNKERWKYIH